jgi:hypothetical protein
MKKLLLNYFIALIFGIIWSAILFYEWGTDFGVHYASAMYLGEDYALYNEIFDHKGPVYLLFLRFIGLSIGWGPSQAYISLLLTSMVYLLPLVFIINTKIISQNINLVILLLILASFFGQSTNIFIVLFQAGMLFFAFYFLFACIEKPSFFWLYWFLSTFFYSISVLTRIDAIIFMPLFFIALIFAKKEPGGLNRFKKISIALIGLFLISCGLFLAVSNFFGFTLEQFIQHNITFNNWYVTHLYVNKTAYIVRPQQISLMLTSGILISLVIIIRAATNKFKLPRLSIFKNKGEVCASYSISEKAEGYENNSTLLFLSWIILILGAIGLILSRSDKNYYIFIFLTPAIFLICYWGGLLNKWHLKYISALALYALFLTITPVVYKIISRPDCLANVFCSASPAKNYEKTVNEVKTRASFTIVGGRGWPHVFSKSKPERAVNDWWLYYLNEPFVTSGLKLSHDRLLMRPPGAEYWIDPSFVTTQNNNPYLKDLLGKSMPVENQGAYWKFKIK